MFEEIIITVSGYINGFERYINPNSPRVQNHLVNAEGRIIFWRAGKIEEFFSTASTREGCVPTQWFLPGPGMPNDMRIITSFTPSIEAYIIPHNRQT